MCRCDPRIRTPWCKNCIPKTKPEYPEMPPVKPPKPEGTHDAKWVSVPSEYVEQVVNLIAELKKNNT